MGGRMSTELLPWVCAEIRINSFVLCLHAQIDILNNGKQFLFSNVGEVCTLCEVVIFSLGLGVISH